MPELQEIFRRLKPLPMSPDQRKAFFAIKDCRTDAMGAHTDRCNDCSHVEISFNSCRNRHCPKCQGSKQYEWVQAQLKKLLPVGYFHVVFTIPSELNPILYQNQDLLYAILIKSAADTLMELAADTRYLGAQIGTTAVLHTWGQNLSLHPHVHCIVPGGGLSNDGLRFVKSSNKFFLPVKVVSRKFRGKFLYHLKKLWNKGKLKFLNDTAYLAQGFNLMNLIDSLYQKDWVVYCKKPFKTPSHVVSYLGRYTHRTAISNSRIVSFDEDSVTFSRKDYKDNNRIKNMSLKTEEFVRRFLLHVLPSGFSKIRHYGILSSRNVKVKLERCKRLTGMLKLVIKEVSVYINSCPLCGGPMTFSGLVSMATVP